MLRGRILVLSIFLGLEFVLTPAYGASGNPLDGGRIGSIDGGPSTHSDLDDLIFSNSRSWTKFSDLPEAFPGEAGRPVMLRFIHGMAPWANQDNNLDLQMLGKYFRIVGVGHKSALIYSGPRLNAEGYQTRLWLSFSEDVADAGLELPWGATVSRIKQGTDPRYTSIMTGCCADTFLAYYRADLLHPDGAEIVRSSTMLTYPDGAIDARFRIANISQFTLRFSPEVNDAPSPDLNAPIPAIGNVARKFQASVFDGVVISYFKSPDGKRWLLVKLTSLDDREPTYADPGQPPVDLGWIDVSATRIPDYPENAPLLSYIKLH